jgi:RND family efflux transporter MFP subunit
MNKFKFLGAILITLVIGLTSCTKSDNKDAAVTSELQIVRVQQVSERDVDQLSEFTATVEPEFKNSIAPATPGRIRKILVEVGNSVVKGQKLVQMDVANLSNSETQIENMKKTYNRIQELFSVGGASQQELDNAKLQLDMARTSLDNLTDNTFLKSPISGIITAKNYDDGDMYSGQMPILTVMSINPVKLMVNVSESNYTQIKLGMSVDVTFDIFQGETFKGKVSLIYPTIDERTRTFGVEIKLNNNSNKIRPGMFGRVTMGFGVAKHVVVPDQSIIKQSGSGSRFVFVYSNGKVEYRPIELGRRFDNEYELISGVRNGEQVVVSGQSKLIDGAEVKLAQ